MKRPAAMRWALGVVALGFLGAVLVAVSSQHAALRRLWQDHQDLAATVHDAILLDAAQARGIPYEAHVEAVLAGRWSGLDALVAFTRQVDGGAAICHGAVLAAVFTLSPEAEAHVAARIAADDGAYVASYRLAMQVADDGRSRRAARRVYAPDWIVTRAYLERHPSGL